MTEESQRNEAVAALRELILAGEQYRLAAAAYLDLTVSESQAVGYLMARGPMGLGELGAALGFTTSSTTALVDRLERNTIAERVAHPTDRRRSIVQLSATGQRGLAEVRSWTASAFDQISDEDLPVMTTELRLLAENLQARVAQPLSDGVRSAQSHRR